MDQRKLKVEPAGKTEGDWWAATPSSTELPEYVPGEFDQLVKHGAEGGEAPVAEVAAEEPEDMLAEAAVGGTEGVDEEEDELVALERHMNALIEAGGKDSLKQRLQRGVSKLRGR